jgi:hypothetical protein
MLQLLWKLVNNRHVFHRMIYAGLSVCHGLACVLTDKPEVYGPMALLYLMLVAKG